MNRVRKKHCSNLELSKWGHPKILIALERQNAMRLVTVGRLDGRVVFSDETKINHFNSNGRTWCWFNDNKSLSNQALWRVFDAMELYDKKRSRWFVEDEWALKCKGLYFTLTWRFVLEFGEIKILQPWWSH